MILEHSEQNLLEHLAHHEAEAARLRKVLDALRMSRAVSTLVDAQRLNCPHMESEAIYPLAHARAATSGPSDTLLTAFLNRLTMGSTQCWYWVGSRSDIGYGTFAAARRYGCPEVMAHRIAWFLWFGDIPSDLNVLHRCDVRPCVNPDHLFLGTQADNVADMCAKGRARFGTPLPGASNGMARLATESVAAMRAEWSTGTVSQHALARKYGVAVMTVNRAVRRQSWRTE